LVLFGQVHSSNEEISHQPFCDLCEKLNSNLPRKIYRDLDAWWYNSTKCTTPEDHGIIINKKQVEELHGIQVPWSLDD
jgi:alpha-1,3-fucosyltransferase